MKINLAGIRQEYTKGGLGESELPDDPLLLFSQWLQEAINAQVNEPTAMIVGTVSPEGPAVYPHCITERYTRWQVYILH